MPEEICCPKFDPSGWDDQVFDWKSKPFVKEKVFTLFYMPVNFGKVMRRLDKQISASGGTIPENLCLSDHTSKWNMDVYVAVDMEIPDLKNVTLSGKYYSKVYEGPYKDTGKWWQDFMGILKSKAMNMKKSYMWYTTCPKCAKKYGKNYVAILAETE
jgi:hypothetical protein